MNKLRDRRGFTLTELLCAVLIVLLVSALLTVGVRFAGRTYNSSMQLSEAQELCSTLTSVISDKLRFCGTVTLQVGTVDSTLAETDFEVRRLNHT